MIRFSEIMKQSLQFMKLTTIMPKASALADQDQEQHRATQGETACHLDCRATVRCGRLTTALVHVQRSRDKLEFEFRQRNSECHILR